AARRALPFDRCRARGTAAPLRLPPAQRLGLHASRAQGPRRRVVDVGRLPPPRARPPPLARGGGQALPEVLSLEAPREDVDQAHRDVVLALLRETVLREERLVREVAPILDAGQQVPAQLLFGGDGELLDLLRGARREAVRVVEPLEARRQRPPRGGLKARVERDPLPLHVRAGPL